MKIRVFASLILLLTSLGFASSALAAVTVTVLKTGDAAEPNTSGSFEISIDVARGADATIFFTMTGDAVPGGDYNLTSDNALTLNNGTGEGSVVILKNTTSVVVNVVPINDVLVEPVKNITLTLTSASLPSLTIGTPNSGTVTLTSDDVGEITLDKTADVSTYSFVDDVINYSYLVTGVVGPVTGPIAVADDKATVTCPPLSGVGNNDDNLDAGEAVTCTASYSVVQADIDAGSITNTATASGDAGATVSNSDQVTVTYDPVLEAALTLDKTADVSTYSAVDDAINYSYLVTSSGTGLVAGPITVADDKVTVTCPAVNTVGNNDDNLDPAEALTCTASYSVVQADIDAGSITNTATASGDAGGTVSNSDQVTVTYDPVLVPALTLDKTANVSTYTAVDDVINYSYLVTSSGTGLVVGPITVSDDKVTVTCPAVNTVGNNDDNLDPGEALTCTASYSVVQADIDAGSITNTATASGDAGATVSNNDQVTVTYDPVLEAALTLDKTADVSTYSAVDDVINYSYLVTSSGTGPVAGPITVSDDKVTVTCPAVNTVGNNDDNLDPAEALTCTASYSVVQADIDAGSITNTATASGDAGATVSNSDQVTVTADLAPALTLDKTSDVSTFDMVDDVINYSYLVTSSGTGPVAGPITVSDDKVTVTCPAVNTVGNNDDNLDPAEALTCTASYSVVQADIDAGSITNIATASGDAGATVSNSDQVTVTADLEGALTLDKQANTVTYSLVDDVIFYSYLVTSTGTGPVAGPITVDDDKETVTCPGVDTVGDNDGNLDPQETLTCTATHTVVQADIDAGSLTNTATASGDSGATISNEDTLVVSYALPVLTLEKSTDAAFFSKAGDVIDYEYLVTASAGPSVGPITIDDDIVTDEACPDVSTVGNNDDRLDPGEQITCTGSYTVVASDITEGSITNVATASGNAGNTVSNESTVTINWLPVDTALLELVITAVPESFTKAGELISLTYRVENIGLGPAVGPITIVDLEPRTDIICPPVDTVGNNDGNLDVGEFIICTAFLVTTLEDTAGGPINLDAVASASDEFTVPGEADLRLEFKPLPIPTLSEWSMILLSFLFLLMGATYLRRRNMV